MVVVWGRAKFQLVDVVGKSGENRRQHWQHFWSFFCFQLKDLFIGIFYVAGVDMHPRKFAVDEEYKGIEPTLQLIFSTDIWFAVGDSTAEAEGAAELFLHVLGDVFTWFCEEVAEFKICQVYFMF